MKLRVGTAVLLALLLLGAAPSALHTATKAPVELLEMDYGLLGLLEVTALRFDPTQVELRALRPPPGKTLAPVGSMPGCDDAVACFNTAFFLEDGAPLGLLASQDKLLQPLRNVTWGVFWIDRQDTPHLDTRRRYQARNAPEQRMRFGIQSGPTVLLESRVKKKEDTSLARRTAIGIDRRGRVVVVLANFPISLSGLGRFARDHLDAVHLMNLDGGSSTQLTLPGWPGRTGIAGAPVAVGAGLFPRDSGSE